MTKHHQRTTAIAGDDGYTLVENASLRARNTMHADAHADLLIDVHKPAALADVFQCGKLESRQLLVLGEGSNVLFARDWPGIVLSMATRGITFLDEAGAGAVVRVEAGENWNDFVHWSIRHGYAGLENLALIPGTVGAAPIQNIGAYGVEAGEFIAAVEAWDRRQHCMIRLDNSACDFAYRDSVFKRNRNRYVIAAVEFSLPRERALRLDYAGVREELAAMGVREPSSASVATAVARIRARKLPNPALVGNVGSFFKNPVLEAARVESLLAQHMGLPNWAVGNGLTKISAAWLIQACGLKGFRQGDAGISAQHALVLVNYGNATGAQLLALADTVRDRVHARFGVRLEPEPLIV